MLSTICQFNPSALSLDILLYTMRGVACLTNNRTVVRHALLAAIYAVAAFLSRRAGHSELSVCYARIALIHGLLGVLTAGCDELSSVGVKRQSQLRLAGRPLAGGT